MLEIAKEAVEEHGAMQKPTELAALLALVYTHRPQVIWEIGTATGGTLWALAVAARLAGGKPDIASIDLPGGPFSGGATLAPEDLRALIPGADLTIIHGDSRFVKLPTIQPDFVLIDGDHSFAGAEADWERYAPLVKPGGLIALHDILPHPSATGVEVYEVWQEIAASESSTVEIVDKTDVSAGGFWWGGIGVVFR